MDRFRFVGWVERSETQHLPFAWNTLVVAPFFFNNYGKKMNHKDTKAQRIPPVICHNFLSIKDGKGGFIAIGKRASQKG